MNRSPIMSMSRAVPLARTPVPAPAPECRQAEASRRAGLCRVLARCVVLAVMTHPAVADAGTFGIPDSTLTVPVVTAALDQTNPCAVPDGSGGAIIAWSDPFGGPQLRMQHVLSTRAIDPTWPPDGAPVIAGSNNWVPVMTIDGAGGAIVAYEDGASRLFAQRILSTGASAPGWGPGVTLAQTVVSPYRNPRIVSDHAGGAFVVWNDDRADAFGSNTDIYAAHLIATGLDPAWPANGLPVCTLAGIQTLPRLCSDGGTGVIVTWRDGRTPANSWDIYAQHVLANATLDPTWPANGAVVSARPTGQYFSRMGPGAGNLIEGTGDYQGDVIVPDGSGGCLIAWEDGLNTLDLYIQHLRQDGTVDPLWTSGGVAICTEAGYQLVPKLLPDGSGGALMTWEDGRNGLLENGYGTWGEVYVQHVLATGAVTGPASGLLVASGAFAGIPQLVDDGVGGMLLFWEDIRDSTTSGNDIYVDHILNLPVPTHDVTWPVGGYPLCSRGGDQRTVMPVATGGGGAIAAWMDWRNFDDTGIDIYSGSVLADGPTATLLTEFAADARDNGIELRWQFAEPGSFTEVRLERAEAEVGPWTSLNGADVRVVDGTTVAWDRDVVGGRTYYYRLVATGPHEQIVFGPLTATAEAAIAKFEMTSIAPNPTKGPATIEYSLPHTSEVELSVMDVQGRVVALLSKGSLGPGPHAAVWSGRTDRGTASPGLYFVRLRTSGATAVRRLVIAP